MLRSASTLLLAAAVLLWACDDGDGAAGSASGGDAGTGGAGSGGAGDRGAGAGGGAGGAGGGEPTGGAGGGAPPPPNLNGNVPYETLSEYGFFVGPLADLAPNVGVTRYEPISKLWSDGAAKDRFIVLPAGATIEPDGDEDWPFPVGSVVIKNFRFDGRHIETRLLIREADGWTGHVYLWDDDLQEARRFVAGTRVDVNGQTYVVPNTNQCDNCHEIGDELRLLGVSAPQLAPVAGSLVEAGVLSRAPAPDHAALVDPFGDAPLADRARSYLHANCGHCHRPGGGGGRSGLVLLAHVDEPSAYGICKRPVAAGDGSGGRLRDIVPGAPDESILVYRMESTDPEVKMPEIPNLLVDEAGVALIREWIAAMEPDDCQ